MRLTLDDFIDKPRDDARERELTRQLRELPEAERWAFVEAALPRAPMFALWVANAVLRDRRYFQQLLVAGIAAWDASSARAWIEPLLPRLGATRVIAILRHELPRSPEQVRKSFYWLRALLARDAKGLAALRALEKL